LRSHSMKSACAIAKAIVNDVEHFSEGEQFDDITLIIARNMG
jgi:serine phosphatase RsbU (regulator of sigma subunit)